MLTKVSGVSIVLPVCNQLEHTKNCLQSIKRHTRGDYQLIVVDNGSRAETGEYLSHQTQARVVRNSENLGFARAVNQGLSMASGDWVVVLNNDCIVSEQWIERLLRVGKEPDVGIVGVMSNLAGPPQQYRVKLKDSKGVLAVAKQVRLKYNEKVIYTTRVVGLCMLLTPQLVKTIGGFDPRYGLGCFEDDDYSVRSILSGFKNAIAQDVFVYHYGSATFQGEGINRGRWMRENWIKFKEKWQLPEALPLGTKNYLAYIKPENFGHDDLYVSLQEGG